MCSADPYLVILIQDGGRHAAGYDPAEDSGLRPHLGSRSLRLAYLPVLPAGRAAAALETRGDVTKRVGRGPRAGPHGGVRSARWGLDVGRQESMSAPQAWVTSRSETRRTVGGAPSLVDFARMRARAPPRAPPLRLPFHSAPRPCRALGSAPAVPAPPAHPRPPARRAPAPPRRAPTGAPAPPPSPAAVPPPSRAPIGSQPVAPAP